MPDFDNFQYDDGIARPVIKRAICMSGGGTFASAFVLGGLRRLNECNLLINSQVFCAASGSSFTMTLLQYCILHKFTADPNWFDDYIRTTTYQAYEYTFLMTVIVTLLNPFDLSPLQSKVEKLFLEFSSKFPKFDRIGFAGVNESNQKFLYSYFNVANQQISYDNSDLVSDDTPLDSANWALRILRSVTSPFTYFNGVLTMDAGLIDNNAILPVIYNYNPNTMYIITLLHDYPQPTTIKFTGWGAALGWVITNIFTIISTGISENVMRIYGLFFRVNANLSYIHTIYPSNSTYNPNLIFPPNNGVLDNFDQLNFIQRNTNGVFFLDLPVLKIVENEGYSQMEAHLQKVIEAEPAEVYSDTIKILTPFNIPNPEYSNATQNQQIVSDYTNRSIVVLMGASFIKTFYKVYPKTSYFIIGATIVGAAYALGIF
jgi:hypothetical protein